MTTKAPSLSERLLFLAIAISFTSPLITTLVRDSIRHFRHRPVRESGLGGVTMPVPVVGFSWRAVASGDFQKSLASQFNEKFAGRSDLIRNTSELWFRLFHETASPSSTVAVGRNDVLFGKAYLREYFLQRVEKQTLAPWVNNLRRLQDFCLQSGMGFVVLVSPNKVALYPEDAPPAWHRWEDPRPRGSVQLIELFQEKGISFVDGSALAMHEKLTNKPLAPLFPKGGAHWNSRAALLVGNAVLARFREQNQAVELIEIVESVISQKPEGEESDFLTLMNLRLQWTYPCERVSIKLSPRPEREQLTMAVVGGSFTWELMRQLSKSRQFSEIDSYFYYKRSKICAVDGTLSLVRAPGTPKDFAREIFAANCLLLEINEAEAPSPEHHTSVFVADALAHLPDPSAPRQPFLSERKKE